MRLINPVLIFLFAGHVIFSAGMAAAVPSLEKFNEVTRLLESWDIPAAVELIEDISKSNPNDHNVIRLKSMAAFYSGDYRGALSLIEELNSYPVARHHDSLYRLIEDTAAATARLIPHKGKHFVVFVDEKKDWVLVKPALDALEKSYLSLGKLFGLCPDTPLRVEVYPDAEAFQKASSLSERDIETSGAIGICKFNKIMVLSPRALVRGYRWLDTLAHEYIHYLLVRLTGNQAPIWVQEGIAKYFEKRWKSLDPFLGWPSGNTLLAQALEENRYISFEDMDPSLVKLDSAREVTLAFAECATAVDFILSKTGQEGLMRFLEKIRELGREKTRQALYETIDLEFSQFEESWKDFVAGLGLKKVEYLRMEEYRLAGRESEEEALMREIQSRMAENHLKLGDKFRKKGRLKPALMEYKRAYRESPGSPYIMNKIAITAYMLGNYDTSLEFLDKALEIAPDYPLSYMTLGNANFSRGHIKEAARSYAEYNEINPFNPELYFQMGTAYYRSGRLGAALVAWDISLRLNPADNRVKRDIETVKRELNKQGG